MNKPSVHIAIPSGDIVQTDFSMSLAVLVAQASNKFTLSMSNIRTPCVEVSRNSLAISAIESGAEYVLWIDSDMVFPGNSLSVLFAHELDFVGVNYARRDPPYTPLCPVNNGLYEVDRIGFGLVLMKTEVLKSINVPMFEAFFKGGQGIENFVSSDYNFCCKAKEQGFRIWVDGDLSKSIGHVTSRTGYLPSNIST